MLSTAQLLAALDSVTAIPIIPFKAGQVDFDAHAKNVRYLMENNYLSENRPRVISIGGTSLLHHVSHADQLQLADVTGRTMGEQGLFMPGIVPNPIGAAAELIERQAALQRPPDAFLLMPLGGIADPEGIYETFMEVGEKLGSSCGARFIYYFRSPRDLPAVIRLLNDSPYFVGVKIGTGIEHVRPMIDGVGDNALVIWGIGDRSTEAAQLGAKGHTSGIAVLCARASDEINNAQRRGDYDAALEIEAKVAALEDIRFADGRKFNYSAVVEAMHLSGFEDIEAGEGGPFNPRLSPQDAEAVRQAIEPLRDYH